MRNSKQREVIYNILKDCTDHPKADVIYERARAVCPKISLGTVYRNLSQLADSGKILTVESVDKCLHYDGNIQKHIHFICDKCGAITDLFGDFELKKPFEDKGFSVRESKCVFYGTCRNCSEK